MTMDVGTPSPAAAHLLRRTGKTITTTRPLCLLLTVIALLASSSLAASTQHLGETSSSTIRPFPTLDELPSHSASSIRNGKLYDYMIGPPPAAHPHPDYIQYYQAPERFFEVNADNVNTPVSEHFTLGQFLCKQGSDYPKYVALQPSLLELLERLINEFTRIGYPVDTFSVISGYRTPWYNRQIGNIPNSRHLYGDAMDFYLDADGNGRMDDLNKDGVSDDQDVDLLFSLIDEFRRRPENAGLIGGIGRYYANGNHGGYIHVDTRGFRSRW